MKSQKLLVGIIFFAFLLNVNAQLTVKDQDPLKHLLFQINDEGLGGSVTIPSLKAITDPAGKLYNLVGTLYWNGYVLGSSSVSKLNDLSDAKFDGSSLFLGEGAGGINDDGENWNTAVGKDALSSNTDGVSNTVIGSAALVSNTGGFCNTAIGLRALEDNTTGNYNTTSGYLSLIYNTTGTHNTACGVKALNSNRTGNFNTAIGYNAGPRDVSDSYALYNTTCLGNGASAHGDNQVRLGNTEVNGVIAYASYVDWSDGRFKMNIKENVSGLDFIMGLRPVTYNMDVNALADMLGEDIQIDINGNRKRKQPSLETIQSRSEKSKKRQIGFIAQEVEELVNKLDIDFSGVYNPNDEKSTYGLRYSQFVVPLVKAVQEQQKIIESLTKRIVELEKREK